MTAPDFEEAVTRGKAQWFTSFKHDSASEELIIGLTHDPEHSATQRVLEFHEVRDMEQHWMDRDDECMEALISAEQEGDSVFRYLLVTDQREIEFRAGSRALIYDV